MSQAEVEIEALWTAVFGQPPAIHAPAEMLIGILVRCLAPAPPYTGFADAATTAVQTIEAEADRPLGGGNTGPRTDAHAADVTTEDQALAVINQCFKSRTR